VLSTLLTVAIWAAVLLAAVGLWKTWNAASDHRSFQTPPWFPYGEIWWTGYRRIQLPAALVVVSMALFQTLSSGRPAAVALVGFLTGSLLACAVALFNRPKALVPPACRAQPGVVAELRARRAARM
jgi:hypothetical protein